MPYFKFKLTDTKSNPFHRLTRKKLIFTIHISLFMYSFGSGCYGKQYRKRDFWIEIVKSTW